MFSNLSINLVPIKQDRIGSRLKLIAQPSEVRIRFNRFAIKYVRSTEIELSLFSLPFLGSASLAACENFNFKLLLKTPTH
jgi:hypothetical protein